MKSLFSHRNTIPLLLVVAFFLPVSATVSAQEKVVFIGDSIARQGIGKYPLPFATNFKNSFSPNKWSLNYISAGGTALKDWLERKEPSNRTNIGFDAFTPDYSGWKNGQTVFQDSGGGANVEYPFIGNLVSKVKPKYLILELGTNEQYLMNPKNEEDLHHFLTMFAEQLRKAGEPVPRVFWVTPHKLPTVSDVRQEYYYKKVNEFLRSEHLGEALDGRRFVNSVNDLRGPTDPHLNAEGAKKLSTGISVAFKDFAKRQGDGDSKSLFQTKHGP